MRASPIFEVRLDRFELWRAAVAAAALAAVATSTTWAWTTAASNGPASVAVAVVVAVLLSTFAIGLAISLLRLPAGVLACRDDAWCFTPDAQASRCGPLTVALDWGSFLLLRLDSRPRVWLPLQRRGMEREWHSLRCAVYAPPRLVESAGAAEAGRPR